MRLYHRGEISGSIVAPAAAAGLYGLKPTVGLIRDGCDGNIAISERFDVVGPMGKRVADLEMMLHAMVSPEDRDKMKAATMAGKGQGESGRWRVGVLDYAPHFGDDLNPLGEPAICYARAIERLRMSFKLDLVFEAGSDLARDHSSAPTFAKGI